ncbi:MAG: pyridoxamine 5'-phosphate oxidase [Verrucomicrobiota bacterium]
MSIATLRREYSVAGLRRADLNPDPIRQFHHWLDQAIAADLTEANAMALATADKSGFPSVRTVLLKGVDELGFRFFTNYESRKGQELAENPRASGVIFWAELERQVCVSGEVVKLSREESEAYFRQRPRGARLGAWASKQGSVIANRRHLEQELARLESEYPGEEVPMPPYWGGYLMAPVRIEFWQGRQNRLHDRFRYTRQADKTWLIERLAP